MSYFLIEDQDQDWQPIMRRFCDEGVKAGYLRTVEKHVMGRTATGFTTTEEAYKAGYTDIKMLFNLWWKAKWQTKSEA